MFNITPLRCTECRICMEICSWRHFEEHTTKRSRIWVKDDWPNIPTIRVCLACKDRECVKACPSGALEWADWIKVDEGHCDSCGLCLEACPVEGIEMDPRTNLPMICDTCNGEFQCIHWCPTQAIERGRAS